MNAEEDIGNDTRALLVVGQDHVLNKNVISDPTFCPIFIQPSIPGADMSVVSFRCVSSSRRLSGIKNDWMVRWCGRSLETGGALDA